METIVSANATESAMEPAFCESILQISEFLQSSGMMESLIGVHGLYKNLIPPGDIVTNLGSVPLSIGHKLIFEPSLSRHEHWSMTVQSLSGAPKARRDQLTFHVKKSMNLPKNVLFNFITFACKLLIERVHLLFSGNYGSWLF